MPKAMFWGPGLLRLQFPGAMPCTNTYLLRMCIPMPAAWLVSRPYCAAMAAGIVEYLLEARAWPSMKLNPWAMAIGMALIVTGEIIRKTAMVRFCWLFACICVGGGVRGGFNCSFRSGAGCWQRPAASASAARHGCRRRSRPAPPRLLPAPSTSGHSGTELHAQRCAAEAPRAPARDAWHLRLGPAPGLPGLGAVGAGHAGPAGQPHLRAGVCRRGASGRKGGGGDAG